MDPDKSAVASVGREIRELRCERGLTQEELAVKSDVPLETLRRIENGLLSPSLDTLGKLRGGLRTTLARLVKPLEGTSPDLAEQICEDLKTRSHDELVVAKRVLKVLLPD